MTTELKDMNTIELMEYALNLEDDTLDMKKAYTIADKLHHKAIQNTTSKDDYVKKEYITFSLQYDAYMHILEEGATAEEAFKYAASIADKTDEYIKEIKNRGTLHNKRIVGIADEHEAQKKMHDNGALCKKVLREASSPNAQLRALHKQKTLSDTLDELKEQKDIHQSKISNLEAKASSTDIDIKYLHEMQGLEGVPPKEKAAKLKSDGHTQKVIAEALDVNIKTIKRWWKTL
jgi:hypothetical protein